MVEKLGKRSVLRLVLLLKRITNKKEMIGENTPRAMLIKAVSAFFLPYE